MVLVILLTVLVTSTSRKKNSSQVPQVRAQKKKICRFTSTARTCVYLWYTCDILVLYLWMGQVGSTPISTRYLWYTCDILVIYLWYFQLYLLQVRDFMWFYFFFQRRGSCFQFHRTLGCNGFHPRVQFPRSMLSCFLQLKIEFSSKCFHSPDIQKARERLREREKEI